jgi:hypothetical protein
LLALFARQEKSAAKAQRRKGAKGAKAQKRRAIKRALSQNGKPQETSAALVSLCFKARLLLFQKSADSLKHRRAAKAPRRKGAKAQ